MSKADEFLKDLNIVKKTDEQKVIKKKFEFTADIEFIDKYDKKSVSELADRVADAVSEWESDFEEVRGSSTNWKVR